MYGPVIKEIRINKGLPLKSVYTQVCSRTNAIKFEKGDRTLAADKFNQVLSNLMMTMDEFNWILNGYQPAETQYQEYLLSKTWNANDTQEFEKNVADIEASANQVERVQLASYRLLRNFEQGMAAEPVELQLVSDYFGALSSWSLSDVKFFVNNCYVLPYQLMLALLQEALKVENKYRYFPGSDLIFAALLSNCTDRMLSEHDQVNAAKALDRLNELISGITMAGYRLMSDYYSAKMMYLFGGAFEGKQRLLEVLKMSTSLQANQLIPEIRDLLSEN